MYYIYTYQYHWCLKCIIDKFSALLNLLSPFWHFCHCICKVLKYFIDVKAVLELSAINFSARTMAYYFLSYYIFFLFDVSHLQLMSPVPYSETEVLQRMSAFPTCDIINEFRHICSLLMSAIGNRITNSVLTKLSW